MISETDIGDYEIIKGGVLGTGAFATVWKGRGKKDHTKLVAIKAIKKKNFIKSQQLLSKEITILKELSSLHHRNVVGLLDCVELKDDVCLVMEYCNGGDLADCLHRNGTLSEDTLCSYVKQIGEAMKALQQKGIVHRDLKPQNILLCYEGNKYPHPSEMLLKIADFGFARFICGAEMATTLCGSPMYMAPEVIMSVKYTAKADLWSIGTILYQCLTGRAPFQAQNPQELKKKYEKSPGLKPNIPSSCSTELTDLLMRMLKRDAEERISFEEFFAHPFLKMANLRSSQPMSVPRRRSSSSSESSTPGKSPGRSSPASRTSSRRMATPSPTPPLLPPKVTEEEMVTTLTEAGGFTKVDKEDVMRTGRSTPEDFVMVPENLCMDSEGDDSVSVKRAPLAQADSFSLSTQRSPNRSPHRSPQSIRLQQGREAVAYSKEADKGNNLPPPVSPSRPAALTVRDGRSSQPITVPLDTLAGGGGGGGAQMMDISSSSSGKGKLKSPDVRMDSEPNENRALVRTSSETRVSSTAVDAVDAGSFSPPSVQFCVGTPPNSGPSWKRSSVVTPPPYTTTIISGSPHRRGSVTSPYFNPLQLSSSSSSTSLLGQGGVPIPLPTIAGSPHRPHQPMFHLGSPTGHDNSPAEPVHAPFASSAASAVMGSGVAGAGYHTCHTVPDNLASLTRHREALGEVPPQHQMLDYHRVPTDPSSLHSHNTPGGMMIPYSTSHQHHRQRRERTVSVGSDRYGSSLEHDQHHCSPMFPRRNSGFDLSPPSPYMTNNNPSPPCQPVRYVPQPLSEETLLDDNHNETLGKLTFVLDLVECVLDLARSLGSAFRNLEPSEMKKVEELSREHLSQYRSSQRHLEQLVLYARTCHLLNSALHMARDEIRNDRLQQSTNLRLVLSEMNSYYHLVVERCKSIHKEFTQNCKTPLTQKLVMATADKLIYNQAIHMCQTAALDEFSSNPSPENMDEVVRRYKVAQILLHSLAQTARNDNDKHMLIKYRKSVESRLSVLTSAPSDQFSSRHHHRSSHHYSSPSQAPPPHHHLDNQRYHFHS